jgi:rhodanese-related sulfurtransferase
LLLCSSAAQAQISIINADQLKSWIEGKKKFVLIDARTAEEYSQGHIPGAINIMPDWMKKKAVSLPRNKKKPLIFYCRGVS